LVFFSSFLARAAARISATLVDVIDGLELEVVGANILVKWHSKAVRESG
jgi:hypothetical protein